MDDTGVIDEFLGVFTSYIDSGFGLLGGEVAFIATTLIVIDVTLAALGPLEIGLIVVAILLVFGAGRLAGLRVASRLAGSLVPRSINTVTLAY